MANPTDFLLNTDYEMDKIIFFQEGKKPAGWSSHVIRHNVSFCPLAFGVWSTTKDFTEPHAFSFTEIVDPTQWQEVLAPNVGLRTEYGDLEEEKYFYLDATNAQDIDVWFRIYAFEPEYSHSNLASTAKNAKTFILNTDYNYRKIAKTGMVNCVADTGQSGREYMPITIKHNLHYKPQVMVWQEDIENYDNITFATLLNRMDIINNWTSLPASERYVGVKVTEDSLTIFPDNAQTINGARIHYRIYYDEAK